MRGATFFAGFLAVPISNFNPRSSCEERQDSYVIRIFMYDIFQSTLLMRGATWELAEIDYVAGIFQSTLLMRGATCQFLRQYSPWRYISIHAPHARSDANGRTSRSGATYFNPRSSCEERLLTTAIYWISASDFNPRSSCEERLRGHEPTE